jgi:beta-glucosidase
VYPAGFALAATWDVNVMKRVGVELGRDARSRGVGYWLGPGVNIYRSPLCGRNSEYFGEDPYLSSAAAVAVIQGVQAQGVSAVVKHFLGNESEYGRHSISIVIDERTAREIYLAPFEAAVKYANVGAVMDSYSIVNGQPMTQNRYFNIDVLKRGWGFRGVLMSDWNATKATTDAFNGGLDLEMPADKFYNSAALKPLLRDGTVSAATLDDHVRRLLRTAVQLGWLDRPQLDHTISRYSVTGRAVALEAAEGAIVLLKNANAVLPFDTTQIHSIAVIGPNAYPAVLHGGGSATAVPYHATSLLEGLSNEIQPDTKLNYARGVPDLHRIAAATAFTVDARGTQPGIRAEVFANMDLGGDPVTKRIDPHIDQGAPLDISGIAAGEVEFDPSLFRSRKEMSTRWTGYYTVGQAGEFDLMVQIAANARYRVFVDDTLVLDNWQWRRALVQSVRLPWVQGSHKIVFEHTANFGIENVPFARLGIIARESWVDPTSKEMAADSDAAVVVVGFDEASESENSDRTFALPPGQDELIRQICAVNPRCVVIVTSGGAVDMRDWLDRVPGVLHTGYLGQEGGAALAKVLFGTVNPSGHLPSTFERQWEDNPVHDSYYPDPVGRVEYREGVFSGYRGYEARQIQPQFPFGYGLSYTTFEYSDLRIHPAEDSKDALYDVSFRVKNTGSRPGAVVTQLYVAPPISRVPRPPKELKGFTKVRLQPGESREVNQQLDVRSFAFYDVSRQHWLAEAGTYQVLIGDSSQQISLKGHVTLISSHVSAK